MVEIGPMIQPLDQRRFHQLLDESLVPRDGGDGQRRADFFQHRRLRHGDHAGVRTKKFAVRQRMREGIAQHDRRPQINAAFKLRPCAGRSRYLAVTSVAPGVFKSFFDRAVDEFGHLGIGEAGEPGVFIGGGQRSDRAELLRARASAISSAYFGTTTAEALMQLRPPLSEMARDHQIDEFRPAFDFVVADENFAVAGAVDLNGGIVRRKRRWCFCRRKSARARRLRRISPAPSWSVG